MKSQGRVLAWLLLGIATACSGGQTGQPDSGPPLVCAADAVTGDDAEALFARFEGTYTGLAVRASSIERCPSGEPVTLSAVVTRSEAGSVPLAERPCGAEYVAVTVAVSTDDGQLDQVVNGWIAEEGQLSLEQGQLFLDVTARSVNGVQGFGELRSIERCCAEPPSDELVDALGSLGSTELLGFKYWYPDRSEHRTRLSLSLTATPPTSSCNAAEVAFELRNADGELAASGQSTATLEACSVANCLSLSIDGSMGAVDSEQALLGDEDFPGNLTRMSLTFSGQSKAGALSAEKLFCETDGDAQWGATLTLE